MTEFSELGEHCSFDNCNLKDFLPIKCKYCAKVYCKEHSSLLIHNCNETTKTNGQLEPLKTFKCSLNDCKTREIIEFNCEFCNLSFCCKHRLQIDHKCNELPKYELTKQEKKTTKVEFNFDIKKNVSEKNTALQSKLILMKMKQTAHGPPGLPDKYRFYTFIHYENAKKPFYLSTEWPIGRCIEFLASKLNITPSIGLKLKLQKDELSSIDTSLMLKDLLEEKALVHGTDLYLFK
jgi:AN1-type zinc finger protein 1